MPDKESEEIGESGIASEASNNGLSLDIQCDNSSAQITTIKLDGTNYLEWFKSMKMYISGRGKFGYISGYVVEPSIFYT